MAEIETEVADIARRVRRLALGAQHQLADDRRQLVLLQLLEQARQVGGTRERARPTAHAETLEQLGERLELDRIGRIVNAVHAMHARLIEGFRRGDVGGDHELLDQPMRIQARPRDDRLGPAVGIEPNLRLRKIEVQGAAAAPRLGQDRISAVQRADHALEQRRRDVVGNAIGCRLHLLVDESGARAHERAHEPMPELAPAAVVPEVHREACPVLFRAQRAQAVGQRRGQHRQHAVRYTELARRRASASRASPGRT